MESISTESNQKSKPKLNQLKVLWVSEHDDSAIYRTIYQSQSNMLVVYSESITHTPSSGRSTAKCDGVT